MLRKLLSPACRSGLVLVGLASLTAVRYYRRPVRGTGREEGMVLGRPDAVPPGQPTVEITGTFSASPMGPAIGRVEQLLSDR
jgi:hypothetical protein